MTNKHYRSTILTILMAALLACLSTGSINVRASRQEFAPQVSPGDFDTTFGTGGKVVNNIPAGSGGLTTMILQPDGKVVMNGPPLTRYNANGTVDTEFGENGKAGLLLAGISALALQPDGKIVAGGYNTSSNGNTDFALTRYNADGSVDSSFGLGGALSTDFFGFADTLYALAVQDDGRIVAAGVARTGPANGDVALVRYLANGSLDPSFGSGGRVMTNFLGGFDTAHAVSIQADGRITIAGIISGSSFGAARYNSNGSLDSSFGVGGKAILSVGVSGGASAMAVQADGRLLLAGTAEVSSNFDFALIRLNANGTIDPSFGVAGKVITDFSGATDAIKAVAIQEDGRILVAGFSDPVAGSDADRNFALARYMTNGSLDTSFGSGGRITTNLFSGKDELTALAIQANGRAIVAGTAHEGAQFESVLAGYYLAADFGIGFNPAPVSVERGQKVKVRVSIIRTGSFNGNVTITPDGSNTGITPKPPDPVATTESSLSFKYKIKGSAAPGVHQLQFTGRDDAGHIRTATLNLLVQ